MPSAFSVVAVVAAYNEADIIQQVVGDLVDQGIQVYFLDDGSTDGTIAAVERYLGRGVLSIERLADTFKDSSPTEFRWERILLRKAQLARELDASWFIHHDADEFRESPWPQLSLKDAIQHVDSLGYNAIDFAGLDFWPVHDRFRAGDDVRKAFTFYSELAPHDRVQVRCWKKTPELDLASSGGHEARFPDRRVFPLRFILRHYPLRGQAHAERKIFNERRGRFVERERSHGWHVQYDNVTQGESFIRDPSTLTFYDADAVRRSLTLCPRYPEEIEHAVASGRAEIEGLRWKLDVRAQEIDRLSASLAGTREELRIRAGEVERLCAEIDARSDESARLQEALEQRAADIEQWRASVNGLSRRIDELEQSLSWRWTAPVRRVYRVLRGSR